MLSVVYAQEELTIPQPQASIHLWPISFAGLSFLEKSILHVLALAEEPMSAYEIYGQVAYIHMLRHRHNLDKNLKAKHPPTFIQRLFNPEIYEPADIKAWVEDDISRHGNIYGVVRYYNKLGMRIPAATTISKALADFATIGWAMPKPVGMRNRKGKPHAVNQYYLSPALENYREEIKIKTRPKLI